MGILQLNSSFEWQPGDTISTDIPRPSIFEEWEGGYLLSLNSAVAPSKIKLDTPSTIWIRESPDLMPFFKEHDWELDVKKNWACKKVIISHWSKVFAT